MNVGLPVKSVRSIRKSDTMHTARISQVRLVSVHVKRYTGNLRRRVRDADIDAGPAD